MRIDTLRLKNFRAYDDMTFRFKPGVNVLIGPNAAGKTTVLEALSVALGSFFLGIRGYDSRHIKPEDVRVKANRIGEALTFEKQYPVEVTAEGEVFGDRIVWARSLSGPDGRTSSKDAHSLKALAERADAAIRAGTYQGLPLIAYYGNGRLWLEPKDTGKSADLEDKGQLSRFMGYYLAIDPRCSPKELMKWMKRQEWIAFKEKKEPDALAAIRQALTQCVDGARGIAFDPAREELVVSFSDGRELPFGLLSDGQRGIAALIGDLGMRAARLNPQFGAQVLDETPGVVLIDEVDLYLHPKWQRTILRNLSAVFPKVQFICTSHSPQVIGEVEPDSIVNLAGTSPIQSFGLDSNSVLREIMDAEDRDAEVRALLDEVYSFIDADDTVRARQTLDEVRNRVGGSDAELSRLETLIRNLEALDED